MSGSSRETSERAPAVVPELLPLRRLELRGPAGGSWSWSPGTAGRCDLCGERVDGLWRYWISAAVSRAAVCADCAEAVTS